MKPRMSDILLEPSGSTLVELAIVLPFLVLLFLGVYDFARAIQTKNMITNMSREGANLVSRSSLPKSDIMNAIAYTAGSLDMQTKGAIYISTITGTLTGIVVNPVIQTQVSWLNKTTPQSRVGTQGSIAQNLGSLTLSNGQTVYIVEVFYHYQSLFSVGNIFLPGQIYAMTIF